MLKYHIVCGLDGNRIEMIFGVFKSYKLAVDSLPTIDYYGPITSIETKFTKYPNIFGEDTFYLLKDAQNNKLATIMILPMDNNNKMEIEDINTDFLNDPVTTPVVAVDYITDLKPTNTAGGSTKTSFYMNDGKFSFGYPNSNVISV